MLIVGFGYLLNTLKVYSMQLENNINGSLISKVYVFVNFSLHYIFG